jgi:hypothetical protein
LAGRAPPLDPRLDALGRPDLVGQFDDVVRYPDAAISMPDSACGLDVRAGTVGDGAVNPAGTSL